MQDLTTVDERIFDFAYELAMRDAVNQTSYNGRGKGSKARLKGCIEAKAAVKSYVLAVMNGNVADFYRVEEQVEEVFAPSIKTALIMEPSLSAMLRSLLI